MKCPVQINHASFFEGRDGVLHGVGVQVTHNQDVVVTIVETVVLVVRQYGFCFFHAVRVVATLSITLVCIIATTVSAFGFEVIDREKKLLASGNLLKGLRFLSLFHASIVLVQLAKWLQDVAAIYESRLGISAIRRSAVINILELTSRVLGEVIRYFCQCTLSLLYLYQTIQINVQKYCGKIC